MTAWSDDLGGIRPDALRGEGHIRISRGREDLGQSVELPSGNAAPQVLDQSGCFLGVGEGAGGQQQAGQYQLKERTAGRCHGRRCGFKWGLAQGVALGVSKEGIRRMWRPARRRLRLARR